MGFNPLNAPCTDTSLHDIVRVTESGGLAQLARAVGSQSTGQGFESPILHDRAYPPPYSPGTSVRLFLWSAIFIAFLSSCSPDEPRRVDLDAIPDRLIFEYPDDFAITTTEQEVRERWGAPQSVEELTIEGTAIDGEGDIRRTFHYDGLQFIFYESAREDFHILAASVINGEQYAIDLGLQVGMGLSAAEDILGSPAFVQDDSHVFSVGGSPADRLNIELVVEDGIVTEIAVSPDIP